MDSPAPAPDTAALVEQAAKALRQWTASQLEYADAMLVSQFILNRDDQIAAVMLQPALATIARLTAERDAADAKGYARGVADERERAASVAENDTCDCAALDDRDCSCGPPGRRIANAIRNPDTAGEG